MGPRQSQHLLNDTLNQATVELLMKNSNTSDTLILQSNYLNLGNNNTITGSISQSNASKINLSSITTQVLTADLQADITNKIAETLEQSASTMPLSDQDQDIKNVIRNVVDTNFNLNTISALNTIVNQSNVAFFGNNNLLAGSLVQENLSDAVIALVNNNTTEVLSAVGFSTVVDITATQTVKTFLDTLAEGIAENMAVAMVCGTAIVLGIPYFGYKAVETSSKNYVGIIVLMIFITLLVLFIIWYNANTNRTEDAKNTVAEEEENKAKADELNRCGATGEVYDPDSVEV